MRSATLADEVTITAGAARRLPALTQREVEKLINSDLGRKILRDAFFSNAHIAFVAKSNGGRDEFGDSWAPLAPRTIKNKLRAKRRAIEERNNTRAWWNIDRRNSWRRNRRNLMQQLQASGMTAEQAKAKATSMAWGRVTAQGGVSINVRTGDLEESLMMNSASPDQVFEVRGDTLVMGTKARTARWMHDGQRKKPRRPARPILPNSEKAAVWIQRGLHLIAIRARDRVKAILRRRERSRMFVNPSQVALREAQRARAAMQRISQFERLLETMEDLREAQASLQDLIRARRQRRG